MATLGAASFGLLRGQGKLRRNLRHDVDLAKDLPDGFAGKKILMDHVEQQIAALRSGELGGEAGGRRDWSGFTIGVIFALAGGYGTLWFFGHTAWWHWIGLLTGAAAALGLFGITEGLMIKKRNAKGIAIE